MSESKTETLSSQEVYELLQKELNVNLETNIDEVERLIQASQTEDTYIYLFYMTLKMEMELNDLSQKNARRGEMLVMESIWVSRKSLSDVDIENHQIFLREQFAKENYLQQCKNYLRRGYAEWQKSK